MDLDSRLEHVAVVGAAGKMGSGIALLLALEQAWRALEHPDRTYILDLIDLDDRALQLLVRYLRDQAAKDGEKQISRLRVLFKDRPELVDNREMVEAFGFEVLLRLRTGRTLALAEDALLVFEAAFEDEAVKTTLYRDLAGRCRPEAFFLSNTSSIPLQGLSRACGLEGRMAGFHFYNPPAVQKLVELIEPDGCRPELARLAEGLAKVLRKQTVRSRDVAGFIGNGHFIRDGLYAMGAVERLAGAHGFVPALHLVDTVSRDFLLRPMGIFQLIDYVGLDVFQAILAVMARHLGEDLHSALIDRYLALGVRGGQTSGGSPRAGFLNYLKGKPVAVFDPELRAYVGLEVPGIKAAQAWLGPHPDPALTWKALHKDPAPEPKLRAYFRELQELETPGGELARDHFRASRETARGLVKQGVAHAAGDVNEVLRLGFFHLYGPINDLMT